MKRSNSSSLVDVSSKLLSYNIDNRCHSFCGVGTFKLLQKGDCYETSLDKSFGETVRPEEIPDDVIATL